MLIWSFELLMLSCKLWSSRLRGSFCLRSPTTPDESQRFLLSRHVQAVVRCCALLLQAPCCIPLSASRAGPKGNCYRIDGVLSLGDMLGYIKDLVCTPRPWPTCISVVGQSTDAWRVSELMSGTHQPCVALLFGIAYLLPSTISCV